MFSHDVVARATERRGRFPLQASPLQRWQRGERPAHAAAVGALQREPLHRLAGEPALGSLLHALCGSHRLVAPTLRHDGGRAQIPQGPVQVSLHTRPLPCGQTHDWSRGFD
jgi:hypothetical protein